MIGTYMPFPDARDFLEEYHHQPAIHITKMTHQGHHSVFSHLHHEKSPDDQSHDKAADDQIYNQVYDEASKISEEPEMTENHEDKPEHHHSLFHLHHELNPKTEANEEIPKEDEAAPAETQETAPEHRHSLFHLHHESKPKTETTEETPKEDETTPTETHEAAPERRHSLFHLPSHHSQAKKTDETEPEPTAELDLTRSEKHTVDNPHWHHALFHRTQSGRHVEKSTISPPISPIEPSTSDPNSLDARRDSHSLSLGGPTYNPRDAGNAQAWSETGDIPPHHVSSVDKNDFAELMEETKGMSDEEIKTYLKTKNGGIQGADGLKILRGGQGYYFETGAMGGTM